MSPASSDSVAAIDMAENADVRAEENDSKGIVYVLTNPAMPGLVKIGMTKQKEVTDRLNQLFTTGVPAPFHCSFAGYVDDARKVERAFHEAFKPNRYTPKREFFEIEPEQARALLELVVFEEVTSEVAKEAEKVDPESSRMAGKSRRPNMNFSEMGILPNAELVFDGEGEHKCIVISEKKVRYEGNDYYLSGLTKVLRGGSGNSKFYWRYEGRLLRDIYSETYEE